MQKYNNLTESEYQSLHLLKGEVDVLGGYLSDTISKKVAIKAPLRHQAFHSKMQMGNGVSLSQIELAVRHIEQQNLKSTFELQKAPPHLQKSQASQPKNT